MRLAAFLCVAWAAAWPTFGFEPLPRCLLCASASRILAPAFGVDLSESYGTSAVHFHNGSVSALSKVDAKALGRLLQRFEQSDHVSYDGQMVLGRSSAIPTVSDLIKATADVLGRLQGATLSQHGFEMDEILLTTFPMRDRFLGLTIARKAARLAGIRLMLDGPADMRPDPVGAAAAANGIGLCSNFTKLDVCAQEEERLPDSLVLGVEYSAIALTVTMSPFQASRQGFGFDSQRHWDLGSLQRRDTLYWKTVKEAIMKVARSWKDQRITDVILMGESATDDDFLRTLQDALWEVLPSTTSTQQPLTGLFEDPVFAAAEGAAVFAKRTTEAPDHCLEPPYCEWWRRRIG